MSFDPRQSNPVGIILVIITLAGLAFAVAIGGMVAHSDFRKLGFVIGGSLMLFACLGLGRHYWLMIPVFGSFTGNFNLLPLPFAVSELAIMVAFGLYVVHLCLKRASFNDEISILDLIVGVNLLYLGSVYLRNPVGIQAFGSDIVGGRPYAAVAIASLAYFVLRSTSVSDKLAKALPLIMGIPAIFINAISSLTIFFPASTPYLWRVYTGFAPDAYLAEYRGESTGRMQRITSFSSLGTAGIRLLYTYFPVGSIFSMSFPFRTLLFCFFYFLILLSGFRGAIVGTAVLVCLAAWLQGRLADILKFVWVGVFAVPTLIILHSTGAVELPLSVQRSLSFLPGDWDRTAASDAEASSEWRFEMWKIVWASDTYLRNRLWGEGFGYSADDLRIQMDAVLGVGGYVGGGQTEAQLVSGAFHSGPLSAIRYVGIVGFLLYMWLMFYMAVLSVRLVRKARGSPFFFLALATAPSLLWAPVVYLFIFGGFDTGFPATILSAATLRLLDYNLGSYEQRPSITDQEEDGIHDGVSSAEKAFT